jgi:hypothetical protein
MKGTYLRIKANEHILDVLDELFYYLLNNHFYFKKIETHDIMIRKDYLVDITNISDIKLLDLQEFLMERKFKSKAIKSDEIKCFLPLDKPNDMVIELE